VRHVRMLGLCLVAALALGAYVVSSASALEWGKCEKLGSNTGLYSGPNCSKAEKASPKGSGEYEWRKASEVEAKRVAAGKSPGVPFTGHSVGAGGILSANERYCSNAESGASTKPPETRYKCEVEEHGADFMLSITEQERPAIKCEAETNEGGHTEGKNKVAGVIVTFTGCVFVNSYPCMSEGAEPGEIVTEELKGKLGWINKSTKEVGVVLEPAHKHGDFASFECVTTKFTVGVGNKKEGSWYTSSGCGGICPKYTSELEEEECAYEFKCPPPPSPEEEKHGGYDQVISPITPVNQMTSEFTQVYKRSNKAPFGNIPHQFEGKHISALEAWFTGIGGAGAEQPTQWVAAAEEITNVNVPEEEGEIKA
jgi:hypothetical protein